MKKYLITIFVLLSLGVSALLLVPVFFDVDKIIRPRLEKMISENLDVDTKIGHLSISLWGRAKLQIMGVDLVDRVTGQSVFKVEEAFIEAPIAPLLDKIINAKVVAKNPSVLAITEKNGKMNWSRLIKQKDAPQSAESSGSSGSSQLPSDWKLGVSIQIDDAVMTYKDLVAGTSTQLKDFDFLIANFSVAEPFNYKVTARLNMSGSTQVSGPAEVEGTLRLLKKGDEFLGVDTTSKINLDQLNVRAPGFEKIAGERLNFSVVGSILKDSAQLKLDSNIESLVAKTSIQIKSYTPMVATFNVSSTQLNLDQLLKLDRPESSPPEGGKASSSGATSAKAKGPTAAPQKKTGMKISGDISINEMIAKKVKFTGVTAKIQMDDSGISVRESKLKVFKGDYSGSMSLQQIGAGNKIQMRGKVSGIDVNEAIVSQMPEFKDTLKGLLTSEYNLTTSGANANEYKASLNGSGFMNIKDGSWSALYGLKMLAEKISSIPGAKDKVADLKIGDKIQTGKSSFRIAQQKIFLTGTVLDMKDTRATVLGGGEVGFDKNLHFKGELVVPLSNPPAALRNSDGRAKLPFELSGVVNGPGVNWNVTTDAVAKAYLRQEGEKLLDQVKEKVKDENLKKILDKAPEGLDKLLKDIKL